ncbi:ribonuclease H2 subunit B-like [Mya arenaria]|uniref:ribonuclease H2 subunit B-like n=1 Tax=Mya arenaria TaxID=6604 RepID=UPI0022E148CA|nr:ribonuclease H2 subunit B-like [Mya arenaria]
MEEIYISSQDLLDYVNILKSAKATEPECVKNFILPEIASGISKRLRDLLNYSLRSGDDDLMAYKYSQEKTLSWLKLKTERLSRSLSQKNICVSGARAEDLVHSKANHEEYLRYAFGIVSDYLPVDLASRLREHLGIPAVIEKRPSDAANPPSKRIKLEDITPTEDYSKNVVLEKKDSKGKQTTAQKKLEKTDKTGMRSLTAFFSPKPKS